MVERPQPLHDRLVDNEDAQNQTNKHVNEARRCRKCKSLIFDLTNFFQVASEETINEILDRYLELNVHAASYTWKRLGRELNMDRNLTQNDIPDETDELIELGIDVDEYIPAIHLYFDDDLTIA